MEIDVEHILDCLDRYQKGELTAGQIKNSLSVEEKNYLCKHQNFYRIEQGEYDVLEWLDESDEAEENRFIIGIEVDESLYREVEFFLNDLGLDMKQLIQIILIQMNDNKESIINSL